MKKDVYLEEPLIIQAKENKALESFQCRNCQKTFVLPLIPFCQKCQSDANSCQHGLACLECSWQIILVEIKNGNLKADKWSDTKIQHIQENIRERFKKEVYIDENNYCQIKY